MPQGSNEEAATMRQEADGLFRDDGDPAMLAWVMVHRAMTSTFRGRLDQAASEVEEARALSREVGDVDAEARAGLASGHLAVQRGSLVEADRALGRCLAEVDDQASPWSLGTLPNVHGRILLALGETSGGRFCTDRRSTWAD
jgi:hypothetical protein